MILAREVIHRETNREGLLVIGTRFLRRVEFSSFLSRFRTRHKFRPGQWQKVAQFRCINEIRCVQNHRIAGSQAAHLDLPHVVAGDLRTRCFMFQQQNQLLRAQVWIEQLVENGQRHTRLVAKPRDRAVARIQICARRRRFGQGIVPSIVIADCRPEFSVKFRASGAFNRGVLIGRHTLLRELAADPIRFFGHHHPQPVSQRRQGRGASAHSSARNDDVCGQLILPFSSGFPFRFASSRSGDEQGRPRRQGAADREGLKKVASVHARMFSNGMRKSSPETGVPFWKSEAAPN